MNKYDVAHKTNNDKSIEVEQSLRKNEKKERNFT